jgi:flagella basal body P-ring formation protein FlgA
MSLAACPAPEAFLQPGARAWGKTTVGVRCAAPSAWTVYIQAQVSVHGRLRRRRRAAGAGPGDRCSRQLVDEGRPGGLPNGVLTDMAQAMGAAARCRCGRRAAAARWLRSKPVVQQGQAVRVVSAAPVFQVSAEAQGDRQRRRRPGGAGAHAGRRHHQRVAKAGGMVEVAF